jgi:hypothetical protein
LKFGLSRFAIASLDVKSVTLKGTLIYRGNQTTIETKPDCKEFARGSTNRSTILRRINNAKTLTI